MAKASSDLVGRTIAGKFVVEEPIGSGAMGAVYRARQIALDKTIAIKVLHGEHADDATFAARFQREAKAASRLNHPNSMQVIDFGEEPDGLLYIAMEYLDGRSLHKVLREEFPLSSERTVDILMQTLAALAVAHDMGVVHRDLKPDNIVILSGTDDDGLARDVVKVCDFGIAKITDSRAYRSGDERESAAPVTTAGFLVGTPEYMSPEQGRGEKLDARSDLYSVGVILFEMLAGRVPFDAENAIGVVLKHITDSPPFPSELAAHVDLRLQAVCMKALRKGRDDRFQTAREMRAELRAALEGPAPTPSSPGSRETPRIPAAMTSAVPSVRVLTATPAPGHAQTVQLEAPTQGATAADGAPGKPTLAGTSAAVPGLPRRRRAAVLWVLAATAVVVGFGGVMLLRPRAPSATASAANGPATPPETTLLPELPAGALPPLAAASARSGSAAVPRGGPVSPHPSHSGGAHPAPSASAAAASSSPVAAALASAAPAAVPSVSPVPAASSASATPSVPAASATAAPAADPDFDPEKAFVEVGLINAQGVRERAVRGALHGAGLAVCYRRALRAQGARAIGTATLDLSIDETGATRSAIVIGADFLPGLARCIQGAAAGTSVARSQVDSGGATAEITLAFRSP